MKVLFLLLIISVIFASCSNGTGETNGGYPPQPAQKEIQKKIDSVTGRGGL